MKKTIFPDRDRTLLNHKKYNFEKVKDVLKLAKEKEISLIFCTGKTYGEIEHLRDKLQNTHPFILENDGGIFIPRRSFNCDFSYTKKNTEYCILMLWIHYKQLLTAFKKLKKKIDVVVFHEMSVDPLAKDADMTKQQAKWTKHLINDNQSSIIVLSIGASESFLITKEKHTYIYSPIEPINSRNGAGDGMTEGITMTIVRCNTAEDAVEYEVTAGSEEVLTQGTDLCRKKGC